MADAAPRPSISPWWFGAVLLVAFIVGGMTVPMVECRCSELRRMLDLGEQDLACPCCGHSLAHPLVHCWLPTHDGHAAELERRAYSLIMLPGHWHHE